MKRKIEWLFFDVGSTLIDERKAYDRRIREMTESTDITFDMFQEKRIYFAKQNQKGELAAIRFFGLQKTPWPKQEEIPYPDAEKTLCYLFRIKQGDAFYQTPDHPDCEADFIINHLSELKKIL